MTADLDAMYGQLSALYNQSAQAQMQFQAVDGHIHSLEKMGDAVRVDDVVKAMGDMVASGHVDARTLAAIAATMPTGGGPQLANWVKQRRGIFDQKMQQAAQQHEQLRDALGKASLQMMQRHIVAGGMQPSPGNPLFGGGRAN